MESRSVKLNYTRVKLNYTQVRDAFAQLTIGGRQQQQCFIAKLPNEMLQAILRKVGEAFDLIKLRSVSTSWKQAIETICGEKKCLIVANNSHYNSRDYNYRLRKRFNRHLTKQKLEKQAIIPVYRLSGNVCTLLANLFPQVELFFIVGNVYSSSKLKEMLKQWSLTLTTLSFPGFIYIENIKSICAQINGLSNLKQLDFNEYIGVLLHGSFTYNCINLLTPTLARLEHFSCGNTDLFEPFGVRRIVHNFGENFTSLGINDYSLRIEDLAEWLKPNAQFVSRLERFGLCTSKPEVLSFICQHFSSLQMLCISINNYCKLTAHNIEQLPRLTNLKELIIRNFQFDLANLNTTNFMPHENIQSVTLLHFKIVNGLSIESLYLKDGYKFSRFLSTIFPNVVKLTVKSDEHIELRNLLEQHVNLFVNLREHDFGLNDPIPEYDYDDGHVDYEDWTNSDD